MQDIAEGPFAFLFYLGNSAKTLTISTLSYFSSQNQIMFSLELSVGQVGELRIT